MHTLTALCNEDGELWAAFVTGHEDLAEVTRWDIVDAVRRDCPWDVDPDEVEHLAGLPVRHFFLTQVDPTTGQAGDGEITHWICGPEAIGAQPVTGVCIGRAAP